MLALFSANGALLASVDTAEPLMDLVITRHSDFVLTGGFGKRLVLRRLDDLEVVQVYNTCSASIRAVAVCYSNQTVLAGLASGHLGWAKSTVSL